MTAPPDDRTSQSSTTLRVVTSPFSLGEFLGRNGRALLGVVVILADVALVFVDVFLHEAVTMPDVALHVGMFLAGLALIDREKVADILTAAKGLLPGPPL